MTTAISQDDGNAILFNPFGWLGYTLQQLNAGAGAFSLKDSANRVLVAQSTNANITYSANGAPNGGAIDGFEIRTPTGVVLLEVGGFAPVSAVDFHTNVNASLASRYNYLVSLLDDATTATGSVSADFIEVGAGADTVAANDGDDIVAKWKAGNLTYNGGAGSDTLTFQAQTGIAYPTTLTQALVVNLATGVGVNPYGGTLALTGVENVIGTGGGFGGFLYGLGDNDTLNGGAGNDNLVGGAGTDTFKFDASWGVDIAWDWVNGAEKFNLNGSGATSFAQLAINQNINGSGNALISFGANQILVVGGANQIDATDFLL